MTLPKIHGPYVREIVRTDKPPRYIIVRYVSDENGGLDTQALTPAGGWVDRPEGFNADPKVIFYGRP